MFDNDPTQLSGPDFLHAVADAEQAQGNDINAAEYRRRAREWERDREVLRNGKQRVRVPRNLISNAAAAK